jgi:hypothetical protein
VRILPLMPLRKILLRIMLWSLIVAAVVGALAVLFFPDELVWRIIGTAATTAVAAGLAIPLFVLTDKPRALVAGLVGLAALIAEYLLTLALIWEVYSIFSGDLERCLVTAIIILLMVAPAMICLWLIHIPLAGVAGWTGSVLCAVVFVLYMWVTWTGTWGNSPGHVVEWATALSAFGSASVVCLVGVGTDRRYWRWVGVVAAVVGTAIVMTAIYKDIHSDSGIFTVICSIVGVVAHANLMELCPLPGRQRWLGRGAIAATLVTAVLLDTLSIQHEERSEGPLARAAASAGILAICGSLAVLVLAAINRRTERPRVLFQGVTQFTIICPVCGSKQLLPVGDARCAKCKLVIRARFEEPRCPNCNYVLLMLESDRCPECGTPVPAIGASAEC